MSTKFTTSPAHGPGLTCLAFSKDGSHAYTGGQDCIVRIWKMDEGTDQEPATASEAENSVTALAASNFSWLSGSEDGIVRTYAGNREEMTGYIWETAAVAIRSLAIDPAGKRVAATSEESFVKVINLEDINITTQLKGHSGHVRKASWHPTSSILTTSGSDGKIIVWNMSTGEPEIEKTIEGVIPAVGDSLSPEFAHDCTAVWHTSGQHFYIASRSHEIVTISREDWSKTSSFTDPEASGAVTALALSVNGAYIASASRGRVFIWSTQTKRLISHHTGTPGATITHLAFSPKKNLLAWTDTEGTFIRWPEAVPQDCPDPIKRLVATGASATVPTGVKSSLFDDIAEAASGSAQREEEEEDLDKGFGDIDDDWIIDDLGGGAMADRPEVVDRGKGKDSGYVKEMVSITKAQPPFQPASTPMDNKKRYLAYNMLGVIEVTDQDTHHIVNVEFFDRSSRKGFHFQDHFKYHLGYLGERGAVFACPPEHSHPAQVIYKPYGTWAGRGEWSYVLKRPGTSVLGVAAGGTRITSSLARYNDDAELQGYGNVVLATSEGDLTFLSGTGRERRIVGLGGDFVSMVAGPEWVFVVHRNGATTIDGSQNLSYSIINFEDFSVKQRDAVPIQKGHVLKWVGLTDQGAPAIYDSAGYVHVLTKFRIPHHASWARVMDTNLLERRQGKDESYWPVGITDNNFMCLILKGRQEYPGFPRPLIQELPLRIPFRSEEPMEESIERTSLLVQTALDSLDDELTTDEIVQRERAIDKELIRLTQAACKADNIPRAIELIKLLHYTIALDSATQIADYNKLPGLREKIALIKADREENDDRLVAARNKRRRWLKPDPPLREVQSNGLNGIGGSGNGRVDPLGDMRPPPTVERPGLARVKAPVIETTRYSSLAPSSQVHPTSPTEQSSFFDNDEQPSPAAASPGDGKRKRVEVEEYESSFPTPPAKQKTNPFARKPGQEPRNPFARKVDAYGKTIQKSESFFDKVGAAEADANGSGKRPSGKLANKEKNVVRQTTLFGMPAPKPKEKEKEKKLGKIKKDEDKDVSAPSKEVLDESQSSRVDDVEMSEPLPETETQETQLQVDSQDTDSSNWEETQPAESEDV